MDNGVFIPLDEFTHDEEGNEILPSDGSFEPVAAGSYVLEIVEAKPDTSANLNKMIVEKVAVVSNADGSASDEAGKTFRNWRVLAKPQPGKKPFALQRFRNWLDAVGVPLTNGGINTSDLIGRRYVARVTVEESDPKFDDMGNEVTYKNNRTTLERPYTQ